MRVESSCRKPPLLACHDEVRQLTVGLCEPLSAEDMNVQSMPQASPAKWHLAHTTWFFETFVLCEHLPGYQPFDPRFGYLFNSYYNTVGERVPRQQRGLLSRPSVSEVLAYRGHVDAAMRRLLANLAVGAGVEELILLGLNHEQQHQELILTDIKHAFGLSPLRPAYAAQPRLTGGVSFLKQPARRWLEYPGGLCHIGHDQPGFTYDNETPRHRVFVEPFRLAATLVCCGEYRSFIEAGGYDDPALWLSDGWDLRCRLGWSAPLYWELQDGTWFHYTLAGPRPVRDDEPVCHISYYEADACARWAGARLPTEAEWEVAASASPLAGSFLDAGRLHPAASEEGAGLAQLFGELWQWTCSPYVAYPGYRPPGGDPVSSSADRKLNLGKALSEYNAKFFINNMVLRGGSCATPRSHFRVTYRNFFSPDSRWQFTGLRFAQDA